MTKKEQELEALVALAYEPTQGGCSYGGGGGGGGGITAVAGVRG